MAAAEKSNHLLSRVEDGRILVLERIFPAPPATVFNMFKSAEELKNWWGPRGWDLIHCRLDFRPGGTWHYCMKCVDKSQENYFGMEAWGKAVYQDIAESKKIVYTDYFSDADGNEDPSLPSARITTEFLPVEGGTRLVSRAEYGSADSLKGSMDMGMLKGITETWDRLEEHLLRKTSKKT